MKVLILSRYDRLGASSRLRTIQYIPGLRAAGCDVTHAPFFDDQYLTGLYSGQRGAGRFGGYLLGRLRQLRQGPRPDVIWLEKELVPYLPWLLERFLLPAGVPVVSDYDDAVFHRYDLHRLGAVRRVLGRKIDKVMAASHTVLAGNDYLAQRARAAGAPNIEIVPTVVDLEHYPLPESPPQTPVIGWIGSPSTWHEYMVPMLPMLEELAQAAGARIHAVGAAMDAQVGPCTRLIPWSEDSEAAEISRMSLGIMPLSDTPWAQGKCGYKLIQYMACGVPVVASPVGVNTKIVRHGENGHLASTPQEWRDAIAALLADADLRAHQGAAGRALVDAEYCLQVQAPRVARMLRTAAGRA